LKESITKLAALIRKNKSQMNRSIRVRRASS